MMQVYFACSITGGRRDEADYQRLVEALQADGHQVPTAANAMVGSGGGAEGSFEPVEVYRRDMAWIEESDALVAEVSTPSHGVGYEVAYALARGIPVLCLARQGVKVSMMLTGNTMPGMQMAFYADVEEGVRMMRDFLES